MSDESVERNTWPLPKFHFSVTFKESGMSTSFFQEVSGLSAESQSAELKDSSVSYLIKMPGLSKVGNIILKRGTFTNDTHFKEWYDAIKLNTIRPETVVISLVDEEGKATITWKIDHARTVKISATDMKSDGNEVAIESIELAHEGLTVVTS